MVVVSTNENKDIPALQMVKMLLCQFPFSKLQDAPKACFSASTAPSLPATAQGKKGVHTLSQRIGDPVTCLWLQGTMCHKTHPPRSPEPSACGNRQSLPNGHVPDGDRSEIGKSHRGYVIIYIYIYS